MPASIGMNERVLRAMRRLQADDPTGGTTVSAIRRVDGELRDRAPMCLESAEWAVSRLVCEGALRTLPNGRLYLPRQRRRNWHNRKKPGFIKRNLGG